jgi:hypothetical protein
VTSGTNVNSGTNPQDTSGNDKTIASLNGLAPNAAGQLAFSVSAGDTANIAYLAAMLISPGPPPGPTVSAHPDVLINFTMSGQPVANPDVFGHYWNNLSSLTTSVGLTNLITTNNTTTTIALANLNVSGLGNNSVGPTSVDTNRLGYFSVLNACSTFYYSSGSNAFAISGLTTGNNYNLRWYGARDATDARISHYTLFCGNGTFTTNVQTTGANVGGTGTNYTYTIPRLVWLTPTNNQIIFSVATNLGSTLAYLNLMEITVNRPPVAGTVTTNRSTGVPLTISTAFLLAQASDPDGDPVNFDNFSALPAGATTNATSITLPGTNTVQTFNYTVDDGNGLTNSGVVTVNLTGVSSGYRDVLIDFGPNDGSTGNNSLSPDYLGQYWNNLNGPGGASGYVAAGAGLANLVTTNNIATAMGLVINNGNFQANGIAAGGLVTPSPALLGNFSVTNATEDYFFTTVAAGAGLTLTNLDPAAVYQLRMFGSCNTDGNTFRSTQYVVTGGNGSFTNVLQTSGNNGWMSNGVAYYGNNNTIVSINGITPDSNRQIQLSLTSPVGGFAYIGILEITETKPAPVANNNSYSRNRLNDWKIKVSDLLTNAMDADNDPVTLVGVGASTNGITLVITTNTPAYVTYSNPSLVADQFSYTVTDGFGGTNTGTVTLTAGSLSGMGGQISNLAFTGGVASMTFAGIPGYQYHVQVSTNLSDWSDILITNAPVGGVFQFNDSAAPLPTAFYRLMWNGN